MDSILGNGRLAQINETSGGLLRYDPEGRLMLFPVRHHSPVCSYQLIRAIDEFSPTVILVEGPENANDLIPVLTAEDTELPAAIYYFYKDKGGLINDLGQDYKCYYPFLTASPEYNALREGRKRGIPARFIDLPFCEILINTSENSGLCRPDERVSYADDAKLTRSDIYKALCEKTSVSSFDEFWEKYFEIEGLRLSAEEYYYALHSYCIMNRETENISAMTEDGTLVRERHMALRIREALDSGERVLAVTGGFHSSGIAELLSEGKIKPVRLHKIPADRQGCFPAAYSYEAADSLNGYSAGMNSPAYYDNVMKRLLSGEDKSSVFDSCSLDLLVRTAEEASKKDSPVTLSDTSAAESLMKGLAALRNISQCGLAEVRDGVTSAFIKGEMSPSYDMPLRILARLASGDAVGRIGDKTFQPPLVADFEKQCASHRLKISDSVQHESDVSLFSGKSGLALSRLFHRLDFLGTGFCVLAKGPDLHSGADRNRVREIWQYRRVPQVDSVLIDRTADGFTIAEACTSAAARALDGQHKSAQTAQTAVDCFLMGIPLTDEQYLSVLGSIDGDGDIFSLGNALECFSRLCSLQELYGFLDTDYKKLLSRCMEKLIYLLPYSADPPRESAARLTSIMRSMYSIAARLLPHLCPDLEKALDTMISRQQKEPTVYGTAMGLLYSFDSSRRSDAESALRGYLNGSAGIRKLGADYLCGLFTSAGDIVLADDVFLKMTDELITGFDSSDFLEILPPLKLAFSRFTPSEIRSIAHRIAQSYSSDGNDILFGEAVDEALYLFGQSLDREVISQLGGADK
ncbi:MAG: hypothetical protein J6M17_01650 [Ruminococcus sp.]|nr:hypothetical protein [Ruminococcus sp.]